MRQADGSDLLGANDPRSASIGIIYVAPGDDRPSVLEAILMQDKLNRQQVAVILPENSRAFQRPVDFDGLKNLRRGLKTEIIFVAPGSPGPVPGPAEFARQRRFTVYTSLDNYKSALRAEQPDESNGKKGLPLFNRRPRLVPNVNAPEPIESFDEPASPPPPFIAPVIPLSAPQPAAAEPYDDAVVVPEDSPTLESFGMAGGAGVLDSSAYADDEHLQPSPASQQNAGPHVAPVVPVPQNDDAEPVRPRSTSGPIPIPLPLPQTGASTKPLTPDARGANGSAAPARSGNTGKQAAIGAAAVGAGAAGAFAAASRTPVAGGGQPPIRGNASGSGGGGGGGGGRPRRRSRRQLLALLLVLLTLLLLAGIAFASPPGQKLIGNITGSTVTATVTITPDHPTVSDSFVVTAVTGTPSSAAQQVQARFISYKSPSGSGTAHASGPLPGANATGTLTFINTGFSGVTINGGTLTGKSGVPVSFSGPLFIPVGSVSVRGTAVNPGVAGNIPQFDIAGTCCGSSNILVRNTTAFGGGRDPIPNSIITQNDINNATNKLISSLTSEARTALQQQVHTNEQVVSNSLKCTVNNPTANHQVGDQAPQVTVTGTANCTEEVYDQKGALAIASNALKAEAAKKPGPSYALVGNVVTNITSATVIDTKGTVSLVISAQGVWVYQFTDTILTSIKNKIAKESQSKAQSDLNSTPGVMSAAISISSGTTMPTNPSDITINVVKIPGLSGSPTPTATTPAGATPTAPITPTTGLGNGATVTPTTPFGGS